MGVVLNLEEGAEKFALSNFFANRTEDQIGDSISTDKTGFIFTRSNPQIMVRYDLPSGAVTRFLIDERNRVHNYVNELTICLQWT